MKNVLPNGYLIRSWDRRDVASLSRAANNPRIAANLRDRFPHPYTTTDAEQWIEHATTQEPETNWAICEHSTVEHSTVIGGIGLELQDDVFARSAELGYWLAEPYWGRGIATAVVRDLVPLAFKRLDLLRIFALVYESNPASARVLEKAGFVCEGCLRKAVVKGSQVLDVHLWATVTGG